ncbi:MAG: adenine phosphoribosyltransferase [Tannerella sp.]|jgi:adenine phosphoribosyltransferase|nr:adenine phosphoribosyltransferase [Tannerella sp.]
MNDLNDLGKYIRNVPDFPVKGIQFKDITTLLKDPFALHELSEILVETYKNHGITKVVGIESRGFMLGSILAYKLHAGFVPIRKPGKLPAETLEATYRKEYGFDRIQIHKDALQEDDVVLIHDDLLATGGTGGAACHLIRQTGVKKIYMNYIIELEELNGRSELPEDIEISSLLKFAR